MLATLTHRVTTTDLMIRGRVSTPTEHDEGLPGRVTRRAGNGVSVLVDGGDERSAVALDPLQVKVATMAHALGSKTRAAEYLGVSKSQPGKWLSGQESPNPDARRLIQDFDYVWSRLTDERSPHASAVWLESPNAFLSGATPLVWLRTRGPVDVVAAVDAEEAGSYA